MAQTARRSGGGEEGGVSIRISATDEASSQITSIDSSLVSLQARLKAVSVTVSELTSRVATGTGLALKQIAAVSAAVSAATIAVTGSDGLRQAMATLGETLDQGLFSRRGNLSDILGLGGTAAKPLIEGALFGSSESNTRSNIRDKGRLLAQDLIKGMALDKKLGEAFGSINPMLSGLGSDVGKGISKGLRRALVDKSGDSLAGAFDRVSRMVDVLAPKMKAVSSTVAVLGGGNLKTMQQNLEIQIAESQFQSKLFQQDGAESKVAEADRRTRRLKRQQEILKSKKDFDILTANFRTGEGRADVIQGVSGFVSGKLQEFQSGIQKEGEGLLQRRDEIRKRGGEKGLTPEEAERLRGEAASIDEEISVNERKKAAADAARKFSDTFTAPLVEKIYTGATDRLSKLFGSSKVLSNLPVGEIIAKGRQLVREKESPVGSYPVIDREVAGETKAAAGKAASSFYNEFVKNLRIPEAVKEQLRTLPGRVGVQEAGANVGLRLGTAIADGLSQAARTRIATSVNMIEKQFNAVTTNTATVTRRLSTGFEQAGMGLGFVSGLREPTEIFGLIKTQVGQAVGAISRVSEEIAFFSAALSSLQQFVVGGPYELLINQNVRLEEQMLATRASIVANNKVLQDGFAIKDPAGAIKALGPEIEGVIRDIRVKSLELVGITSKELIDVFDIITQQVSNVNLSLEEAGDLTIAFAAGLGTIGLPLNQARQEIQSILTGQVDMNSVLAKSLGITNAQLKTWIAQDVVYERLNQRLSAFVEGNSLAARTINGISSNIQEVVDEIGRVAGAQFLEPIVTQMESVYRLLSENQRVLAGFFKNRLGDLASSLASLGRTSAEVGQEFMPILVNALELLWNTVINVIKATEKGVAFFGQVASIFVPILTEVSNLIKAASGPVLQLAISFRILGSGLGLVRTLMGSLVGAIPILGESLFLLEVRNGQLVNTFAALSNPKTGIGAAAASILLLGRNMNTIPGLATIVGTRLQNAFGPLAGVIATAIPSVSTFTLRLLALGQQVEPVGEVLKGFSQAAPGAIRGLVGALDRISVGGVKLSVLAGPLRGLSDEIEGIVKANGDLGDILNKKLNGVLQEQGRLARDTAIRYGLWGIAVAGLAASISVIIVKNDALRIVLGGVIKAIWGVAKAIVDGLLSPLGQVVVLTTSLVTLIATGAAVQMLNLTRQFTAFAATKAPIVLSLMVDRLKELTTILQTKNLADLGGIFAPGAVQKKGKEVEAKSAGATTGAVAGEYTQLDLFEAGAGEADLDAKKKEEDEKRKKKEEEEKRKKGKGAKRRPSEKQLDIFGLMGQGQDVSDLTEGMIGTRKEMTKTSRAATEVADATGNMGRSSKGAAAATTALGNANLFVSGTVKTLGAAFKSLLVTVGPLLGLVALFSAVGYAIIETNKASEAQKELQKDLLEIYKAQTEALVKINSLQDKKIENPLAGKITEADLKTAEERAAFKEGGGEAVLAVRRAREFNEEGGKKSGVRRFAEQAMDVTAQGLVGAVKVVSLGTVGNKDDFTSTTALRTTQAQEIAGTEVLVDAGAYFEEVKNGKRDPKTGQRIEGTSVSGQIRGLILQSKETEKLLAEAKAAGQEARTRELENRLKQEQEAIGAGQDEILNYASALETKDFATDAQKEDAINIAKMLRDVVNQLEGDIEVRGVDFARLGTSFEQLRVEAENALAFFDRGEGNPEQVKQRAGQLLSATQQQLESGLIPAEKALENYAVLFKRNNALELDDQKKLQEAILAARQKQTESSIKLEEAKNARLKQLAAEGRIGRFESELGEMESERRKAEAQLEGLRAGYEEQNALRLAQFKDTESSIQKELNRSRLELAVGRGQISAEDPRAKAMEIGGTRLSAEGEQALLTEISGYQDSLTELGESFRYQQQKANRDFVTEESTLLAQLADSINKELEMRLKELQDRATSALEQSMALRKAQYQELRKEGIIFAEQQELAVAQLQEDRVLEEIELEKVKLREFLKNPKRFEREIRESNKRIAQLTLERFEAERAEWEKQLALFQRYVNDQAEAAKNAIEIENQELIKQSKLYEAIGQAIEQRNNLLNKSKDFIQSTGSAIADNLERMAKLTGNEVLQADLGTIAAIVRRDTLAQQLEIQAKIFEIEQKQAEIALIRKEAENAIALAKAKQQIISAQGEVVVARERLERGDITEAEYTSKQIDLMTAALEYKGLEMERSFIAQEREMMPIVQGLQRQQQEQQMEQQLLSADLGVLETMPQALRLDAQGKLLTRIAQDMGVEANNRQEAYQQFRGVRGEVQSDYAQRVYGDAGVFTESEEYRMAQATGGDPNANVRYLQSQGIDLSLYSEMGNLGVTPVASVPVYENAEGVFESGTGLRGSSGAFDPQTERLAEMMTGVEEATAGMDASIEDLSTSMEGITLENLQAALPEIVGRDAIIQTTFESAGNVQAAIEEGLGQSNVQLETITEGLEPLADVRDFLGADGPLHQSLEKLDLEPYLGEGTQLLRSTSSIESMVGRIATAVEAEPAAEPAAEPTPQAATPTATTPAAEPKKEEDVAKLIPTFVRDFEKLLSADALKAARGWGSEGGWRVTESELRNTITQTLTPLLSADSRLQIDKTSTQELIGLFQQSFGEERRSAARGGRGMAGETRYQVNPNLTFNINGSADEKRIAQTAIGEFEKVLDRALATR